MVISPLIERSGNEHFLEVVFDGQVVRYTLIYIGWQWCLCCQSYFLYQEAGGLSGTLCVLYRSTCYQKALDRMYGRAQKKALLRLRRDENRGPVGFDWETYQ